MFDETARSIFTVENTMYRKKSRIIYNLFRKMSSQRRNDYLKHFFPFRTGRLYRHHKNVSIRCLTVVLVKCIILIFSPCFQLLQQANATHRRCSVSRSVKHPDLTKINAHNNRFNSTLDHVLFNYP